MLKIEPKLKLKIKHTVKKYANEEDYRAGKVSETVVRETEQEISRKQATALGFDVDKVTKEVPNGNNT